MITDDLRRLYASSDGVGLADTIRRGETTAQEIVEVAVEAIERLNPRLNAVIHKAYDHARAAAAQVRPDQVFAGVPFLIKELATMWAGMPLTNSSAWMKHVVAPADSEFVHRIKSAGFVLIGKSNAPENGWAITTEPRLYGATHNPWRDDVTAGGSSGGSAAAVAARMVPMAEGSDGAGSIRVPASCCGLVGLKPSRGRVTLSPFGDFWYGGAYFFCVSRSVRDNAEFLDAVAGYLPGEPYTPPRPERAWRTLAEIPPRNLRIGFTLTPPDGSAMHPEVSAAVRKAAETLTALGHSVEQHDMSFDAKEAWRTYTRMTAVQTEQTFEALVPLVGRPVTKADVEPITWAILERGRSINGVQHAADIEKLRLLSREIATDLLPRRLRHADLDAAAALAWILGHERRIWTATTRSGRMRCLWRRLTSRACRRCPSRCMSATTGCQLGCSSWVDTATRQRCFRLRRCWKRSNAGKTAIRSRPNLGLPALEMPDENCEATK